MKYNNIKDSLRVRVAEKTIDNYKDSVYQTLDNGLALVPYYELVPDMKITISRGQFAEWEAENENFSLQTLIDDALKAGMENDPAYINTMFGVVSGFFGEESSPFRRVGDRDISFDPNEFMFVISNESREEGAAVLFYPGVMHKASEVLGEEFYVLPSSIHEMILVKESNAPDLEDIKAMVREINAAEVRPEDQLSDNVYFYDKALDKLVEADSRAREMEESLEEEEEMEL